MTKKLLLAALLAAVSASAALNCDNFKPYEEIHYSMPLLRGECGQGPLAVLNETTGKAGACLQFQGRYKALVDLVYGTNVVLLSCAGEEARVPIVFTRMESENVVKFYYVLPAEANTDFYTPPGYTGENTNYWDRFDRAAKIMQTFSAHDLDDHPWGYGKKTFPLELDDQCKVVVHVCTSKYTLAEIRSYRKADGKSYDNYRFHAILREAVGHDYSHPTPETQYVVVGNTTELENGIWVGHTATGGGGLGAFGSGALYTWPTTLQGVFDNFLDNTPMDPAKEVDDSCGRHRRWAHFATTLGATIHENGHALGLPHFYGKYVIMSRGHDQLNRVFTFFDPPTERVASTNYFSQGEIGHWSDSAAAFLNEHPFFNPNRPAVGQGPKISEGRQPSTLVLEDESGIVWYAYKDSDAYHFSDTVAFDKPYPKRLSITRLPSEDTQSGAMYIVASNGNGYKSEKDLDVALPVKAGCLFQPSPEKGYAMGSWKRGAQDCKDRIRPILRADSFAELAEPEAGTPEGKGLVLKVWGTGSGVKLPAFVGREGAEKPAATIGVSCLVKPVPGHTILDLKDSFGVSFCYLEYKPTGDLAIHATSPEGKFLTRILRGVPAGCWQKVSLVCDLESRLLTSVKIDGQEFLDGSGVPLGSQENVLASVWLKNTSGKDPALFRDVQIKLSNK